VINPLPVFSLLVAIVSSVAAGAHEPEVVSTGMPVTVQDIAPAARDAVQVVDAFSAAIKAAKVEEAGKFLDAKALVLESGGSERSRAEYLREHAIADATFMQSATQQLRYRQARAEGNVAWVGSESDLQTTKDGKPVTILSTETMVLRKGADGWRIVHIHWSSRQRSTN